MLIFFIAKISGHSLARDVDASKWWIVSTWQRYPYIYWFHIFAIAILVALVILQKTMT